ncbi:MAG: alpha/beta hydrolase family protein, partial [Gemmatimonadota bacterium]
MKRRWFAASLLILALAGAVAYFVTRPEPNDTRHNGAYAVDGGEPFFVTARGGSELRIRWMDGRSHRLLPADGDRYRIGAAFSQTEPTIGEVAFETTSDGGRVLVLTEEGAPPVRARRLELPEEAMTVRSAGLELRGRLVLPDDDEGEAPFPAVVLVHGSEDRSAVETYVEPYVFASHGIATLVFDKRGTGESDGDYTQNFDLLADDVVAAVRRLREHPRIDTAAIHLAGFSQGGWIAPLAAARDGGIRSVLVGYGPAVPVTAEDRWGYVYQLRQEGFGEDAIAAADSVNAMIEAVMDRGEDRWEELGDRLDAARDEPWFDAVRGSDSMLGFLADSWMPMWMIELYGRWRMRGDVPFIDRTYDPVPTLDGLDVPSLWLLGGEDYSSPTGWTLEALDSLRERGRPIQTRVFDAADHGILLFEEDDAGRRRYTRYAPDYFPTMVEWLRGRRDG